MSEKEVKELMEYEFGELMYAWSSPIGSTNSILQDYEDYFEKDSKEYYYHIKSLYLLNCSTENLTWYKERKRMFIDERIKPLLLEFVHVDVDEKELRELTVEVKKYLFDEQKDINEIEKIMKELSDRALKREENEKRIRKLFGMI